MNNEQFRRLIAANSAKEKNGATTTGTRPAAAASTPRSLGSKLKSSIPMTPRSVAGAGAARNDFARQLAEKNQPSEKAQKKFRISAPKGSKLAQGYVDRAKTREEEEEDERAARLKALEESLKKYEIDQETYDRQRAEIAGGDLSSTHLVKGLDFKLLERIRKGEDVYGASAKSPEPESGKRIGEQQEKEEEDQEEDVDDVLERLESTQVKAITKEKTQKKGQLAPVSLMPGQKRSRNQILAELKAAREAAAKAKEESGLGSKFKKIGAKKTPGTRIERDDKGREVMIIVDEDGHERRKVRKLEHKSAEEQERDNAALVSGNVLGMEVPDFYKKKQQAEQAEQEAEDDEKEIKIFDDAESDYDPLAGLEDSDESSDEEGVVNDKTEETKSPSMPPPPKPVATTGAHNYFKGAKTALTSEETYKAPSINDPSFLAALRKAKAASAAEKSEEEQRDAEREQRLKKKLEESNRDDADLDLGFGSSRVEDEADLAEAKVKLSEWRGGGGGGGGDDMDDDDEGGDGEGGAKSKRKRGPKKKKGDKNSFVDVMRVIDRNKAGK
ncbi:hypothetical protein B0T19DRAFT_411714 [Cercophora scortea]|uniref:RED-like N-terminal domain-containing protein n=1 Tax=Cercophora scortea TaxID=314031 RepID=A0AAE0MM31_9PEZI|nr:hypothetical protein B0T19DRAFT_411714 [Cercophora scortea]